MYKKDYEKFITIPNILSLARILILVPFVLFVSSDNYVGAGLVLILSGLTDLFDGYLARKLNQITRLGKMLDPTADKLTLMTVMICASIKFPRVFPFMMLLIIKEVLMLLAGAVLLRKKMHPPASKWYGKVSTVVFYVSITTIIGIKAIFNVNIESLDIFLMSLTSICMLYSLAMYFSIFVSILKNGNDKNINKKI